MVLVCLKHPRGQVEEDLIVAITGVEVEVEVEVVGTISIDQKTAILTPGLT